MFRTPRCYLTMRGSKFIRLCHRAIQSHHVDCSDFFPEKKNLDDVAESWFTRNAQINLSKIERFQLVTRKLSKGKPCSGIRGGPSGFSPARARARGRARVGEIPDIYPYSLSHNHIYIIYINALPRVFSCFRWQTVALLSLDRGVLSFFLRFLRVNTPQSRVRHRAPVSPPPRPARHPRRRCRPRGCCPPRHCSPPRAWLAWLRWLRS